jgi:hypothetical protein
MERISMKLGIRLNQAHEAHQGAGFFNLTRPRGHSGAEPRDTEEEPDVGIPVK